MSAITNWKIASSFLIIIQIVCNLSEVESVEADPNFCLDKRPGFYADASSNCTGFYNCPQLLQQSFRFPCIDNRTFDVETCSCQNLTRPGHNRRCVASKEPCSPTSAKTTEPTTTVSPLNSSFSCYNRPAGLYPDIANHCQNYFSCLAGPGTHRYPCPSSQAFDHQSCTCRPYNLVQCNRRDDEQPCRRPPLPTTTTHYPTTNRRSSTTTRSHPTPSTTVSLPPPSNFCLGHHEGYYSDTGRDCEWFFICQGGDFPTTQLQCPSHLRFDSYSCRCEYPFNVPCTVLDGLEPCDPNPASSTPDPITTRITTTVSPPTPEPPGRFCKDKKAGFYADRDLQCEYFYSCVDGTGRDRLYRCIDGYRFDQRLAACRPEDQVSCNPLDGPVELAGPIVIR